MSTPLRATSCALCRVARATFEPATSTDSMTPYGVTRPVRAPPGRRISNPARVDLLGREQLGGRPARRARGRAEGTLQVQVVDLDDDAVDLVDEAVAVRADLGDPLFDSLPACEQARVG